MTDTTMKAIVERKIADWRDCATNIIRVTDHHPDAAATCLLQCANELESALSSLSAPQEDTWSINPQRLADLSAQCIDISKMMAEAGIGPCTLREGVRTLIQQRDEAASALSATQTREQDDPWQPIETAPKDGSRLLIVSVHHPDLTVRIGWWDHDSRLWTYSCVEPPTHWMPLPASPIPIKELT